MPFLMCRFTRLWYDCVGFFFPRDGHSVLVHGSEGTDSTLVISTIAQLIMDPCCRTLEGFLALLEREWVQVSELISVISSRNTSSRTHKFFKNNITLIYALSYH